MYMFPCRSKILTLVLAGNNWMQMAAMAGTADDTIIAKLNTYKVTKGWRARMVPWAQTPEEKRAWKQE